jgi:hypothetical protein
VLLGGCRERWWCWEEAVELEEQLWLPRPGEWRGLVRRLLGEFGTAAVGDKGVVVDLVQPPPKLVIFIVVGCSCFDEG